MASLQIEVASSSSPFNYSLRDHNRSKNITGYMTQCIRKNKAHDGDEDSSWLPSQSSKTDDSWLPTHVTSKSDHRKGQTDVDDSWLPANNDTKGKGWTNTSQPQNDIDYSWLPATYIDKKQKNDKIKDKSKIKANTNTNTKTNTTTNTITTPKNKSNNENNNNSKSNIDASLTQKKPTNNHWALAREVVFSSDQHAQDSEQQDAPSVSRSTVESPSSEGVSSLRRRWSALAETKNSNKDDNLSPPNTRSNLGSKCKENKFHYPSGSPSRDGFRESKSSSHSPPSAKDSDLESDNISRSRRLSCPLPDPYIKESNASKAEKEKFRVGDIIKKLSKEEILAASQAGGNGNEALPRIRTSLDNQQIEEHKGFKGVKVSGHLIRGRQDFNNFLMVTEHDKDREIKWLLDRKPVSKFSNRGRLQAMLRFKALRIEAEPKPKLEAKKHRRCVSKTLDPNNRLAIMDLREKFDSGYEKGETKSRKHKSVLKNTQNEEHFGTPTGEMDFKNKTKTKFTSSSSKKHEQIPKPEPMTPQQSTRFQLETCKYIAQKAKEAQKMKTRFNKDDDKYDIQEDEGQFMSAKTSYSQIEDRGLNDLDEMVYTSKKQPENYEDWMTSEYSQTRSDLDENESYDMQPFDTNYDWITEISRPKSDWEILRQARYQDMLERSSGHVDIPRLLERKKVSSFLSSSLRDLIDQVMMSRVQQSLDPVEKQHVVTNKGLSKQEDKDRRNRTREYSECSEYVDRTPESERSWRPNDEVYSSETTTTTTTTPTTASTSPSLEQSPASNRSQNNGTPQSSPPVVHPSVEMELIYDLRGHMAQLHQEIMELRRSIKGCVSMQVKMQVSLKQNVAEDATIHSVQNEERKPPGIGKTCSICGDMQINSLLYRCGHMCTCFNCAVELQRTCGECPICEAPIEEVVMAFVH